MVLLTTVGWRARHWNMFLMIGATLFLGILAEKEDESTELFLLRYNEELRQYRHFGAELGWNMSINMTPDILDKNDQFVIQRNLWNNEWCSRLMGMYFSDEAKSYPTSWDHQQIRELFLICRGPRFTSYQLSNMHEILAKLQKMYNQDLSIGGKSLRMEPDLNRLMASSRDETLLKDVWTAWHEKIGPDVKPLYISLVQLMNKGAKQAGHADMGEIWRQETEVPDLKNVAFKLYRDVKYLYELLHTFVRFKLQKYYKMEFTNGGIPTHLLGNMYAQNWQSLIDLVWEDHDSEGFEALEKNPIIVSLSLENATVTDMVKAAEGFFTSMGLPTLPPSFWENSYFEDEPMGNGEKSSARNCHGSAANMFGVRPDYRMMMCAEVKDEDMVTFQHEIGHIYYFMAYRNLPTVFQDGANSAFHEAVGDSVTYDLQPRNVREKEGLRSLLQTGLAKIPQVGFGLIMDLWRWNIFEKDGNSDEWNEDWWKLHYEILGVVKPAGYGVNGPSRHQFDAAGKFHIIDNVPYIRYFLASFLQLQFYEAMCKAAGWNDMHFCRIRGSKAAGHVFWKMMGEGSSRHWSLILEQMTGSKKIQAATFLRYFQPLQRWLERRVVYHNLTLGW